jgi:hypothetical protein
VWLLFLEAYFELVRFHYHLKAGSFESLYTAVRNCPVAKAARSGMSIDRVCSAVDRACIWYPNEVLCLQRSAATACLLRKHGIAAQLVIGVQRIPFKAHAWVEVGGSAANDKSYVPEMYAVLDRC